MSEITVVDIDPQMVLGTRKRGKYEIIAQLIPKVCEYAVQKEAQIQGPPIFVCHEKTVEEVMKADSEGNADVEVVVPVSQEVEETEDIKYYELPGGKMAKIIHKGPYEECEPTYRRLYAWIEENQKCIVGPIREIYMNDPREVPKEEIITEIYAPIG
ncbi:MAG: GyrI-like domain-containing protein [Thermoplasmata archaeon]|nr:MAG: GyrI-like domain-containing protein [Thermoplasmata archaeon]